MKLSGNLDLSRYAYAENVAKRRLGAAKTKTIFDVGAGDGIMRRPLEAAGFTWLGFDIAARDGISRGISAILVLFKTKPPTLSFGST